MQRPGTSAADAQLKERTPFQFEEAGQTKNVGRALKQQPFSDELYQRLSTPKSAANMQAIRGYLMKSNLKTLPSAIELTDLKATAQADLLNLAPLKQAVSEAQTAKTAAVRTMESMRTAFSVAQKNVQFAAIRVQESKAAVDMAKAFLGGRTAEEMEDMIQMQIKEAQAETEYKAAQAAVDAKNALYETATEEYAQAERAFQTRVNAVEAAQKALQQAKLAVQTKGASVADALKILRGDVSSLKTLASGATERGVELQTARLAQKAAFESQKATAVRELEILKANPKQRVLDSRFRFKLSSVSDAVKNLGRTSRYAISRLFFRQMGVAESKLGFQAAGSEVGKAIFDSAPNDIAVLEESGQFETTSSFTVEEQVSKTAGRFAMFGEEAAAEGAIAPYATQGGLNVYMDLALAAPLGVDLISAISGWGVPSEPSERPVVQQFQMATPNVGAWVIKPDEYNQLESKLKALNNAQSNDLLSMLQRQKDNGLPVYSVVTQRGDYRSPDTTDPLPSANNILHQNTNFPTVTAKIVGRLSHMELATVGASVVNDTDALMGQSVALLKALGLNPQLSFTPWSRGMPLFYVENLTGAGASGLTDAQRAQLESLQGSVVMPGGIQDPVAFVQNPPTVSEIENLASHAATQSQTLSLLQDTRATQQEINLLPQGSLRAFKQANLNLVLWNAGLLKGPRPIIPEVPYTAESIAAYNVYQSQLTSYDDEISQLQQQIAAYSLLSPEEKQYQADVANFQSQINELEARIANDAAVGANAVQVLQDALEAQQALLNDAQRRQFNAEQALAQEQQEQTQAQSALTDAKRTLDLETSQREAAQVAYQTSIADYQKAQWEEASGNAYAIWLYNEATNQSNLATTTYNQAKTNYEIAEAAHTQNEQDLNSAIYNLQAAQLSNSSEFQTLMQQLNRSYGSQYQQYNDQLLAALQNFSTTYDAQVESTNTQIQTQNLGLPLVPYFDVSGTYEAFKKNFNPLSGRLYEGGMNFKINIDEPVGYPGTLNGPPLSYTARAYQLFYERYTYDSGKAALYGDIDAAIRDGTPAASFATQYGIGTNSTLPVPTYTRDSMTVELGTEPAQEEGTESPPTQEGVDLPATQTTPQDGVDLPTTTTPEDDATGDIDIPETTQENDTPPPAVDPGIDL